MLDEYGRPINRPKSEFKDEPYWARVRVAILGISIGLMLLIGSKIGWLLQITGVIVCLLSVCVAVYAWVMDVMPIIVRVTKEWIIHGIEDDEPYHH